MPLARRSCLAPLLVLLGACADPAPPPTAPPPADASPSRTPALADAADSLAWRIAEAAGGLAALDALDTLRFDFAVVRGGEEAFRRRLLWAKTAGRARVEYPAGPDTTVVVVLDVPASSPERAVGEVWIDGARPDSADAFLADAYGALMNDSYWLLAPLKLFDDGVRRALAPDSADAETDVLHVTFAGVGHTPGDQYWLRADRDGRLLTWAFRLESGREGFSRWTDYATLETPAGPLRLAETKAGAGASIRTELRPVPTGADVMTRPTPAL